MININNTPWDKLTFSDIQALLESADGETFFFEFKSDEARNQTLHKEISAFANTYGGYILLGISDDKPISGCKTWNEQRIHNVIHISFHHRYRSCQEIDAGISQPTLGSTKHA